MWRISSLLWPAVEWWERRGEHRRVRYCLEHRQRKAESPEERRKSRLARMRSVAALFLLTIVGRG
jgi:hypothetical protein